MFHFVCFPYFILVTILKAGPNIIRGYRRELTYFEVPVRSDIPKTTYADRGVIKEIFDEVDEEAIAKLASERENSTVLQDQRDTTVSDGTKLKT